jgi:hypothetical protein
MRSDESGSAGEKNTFHWKSPGFPAVFSQNGTIGSNGSIR